MSTMLERAQSEGLPIHTLNLEADERLGIDPFGVWDEATEVGPLFYSPANRGFLVAADYDTIKTVLRDNASWSSLPTTIVYTKEEVRLSVPPINMDPPIHTKYRRALIPFFSPQELTPLEPRIHALTNQLIDDIIAKGECQFTADFASLLPARFFLGWLGLDDGDTDHMFHLAERATFEFPTQEERDKIENEIDAIVGDLFARRRKNPKDDLASKMITMQVDGAPIDEKMLVDMGKLCFIAGQETTSTQLGYIMWHLARTPEDREFLVRNPEQTNAAVEELTRYYNTGGPAGRIAKKATTLNGFPIEPGDRIFIARCGADRLFSPTVQLDREVNRHTAFGLGIHRCLGSHVARIEMEIGLRVWHERLPNYRIKEGFVPRHRYGAFMQQLTSLPLEFF
ncbi:cytochrome P450 [Nocardia alni]|uniref:cytochrome P450 n=1 Tax=Nocardia alni TaxID=2815723 RepID=UPI001C23CB27|nr:cytochrome P450 [Nocardia alni]